MLNKKTKQFSLRIPAKLLAQFKSLCASRGITMTAALVEMIEKWIEKHK
jgi:predicted DNA-binding protein